MQINDDIKAKLENTYQVSIETTDIKDLSGRIVGRNEVVNVSDADGKSVNIEEFRKMVEAVSAKKDESNEDTQTPKDEELKVNVTRSSRQEKKGKKENEDK